RGTNLPPDNHVPNNMPEPGMIVFSIEDKIIGEQGRQELATTLGRMMGALTKRQRQAVHLRYYCNMSYPCIARAMGIGTASVYNLISKALEQIRSRVGNGENI